MRKSPLSAKDLLDAIEVVKGFVRSFEPGLYPGEDAKQIVSALSELKRVAASGLILAAKRVEETHLHELDGHKRADTWLAGVTGESVGQASSMLESANSIQAHPEISEAFRSGRLSEAQAKEIASAADACPNEAANLVEAAAEMQLRTLKRHCSDVRAVASSEDESIDRYEQMRRKRFCRIWKDSDDFGRLEARVTPDALAVLLSCLKPFEKQAFSDARKEGRHESLQAYMADALVSMAKASRSKKDSSTGGDTLVRVRVDLGALKRGHPIPGETCSIPGLAPLPVALVREILGDSLLELIVTEGQDVRTVCSNSRHIKRALQIALEERDPTCCVPDCDMSDPLEVDHWATDYAKGGETKLDNLARLCTDHHDRKTYKGWRLEGGPGQWRFVRPDPPPKSEHPEHLAHLTERARPDRSASSDRSPDARATGPPGQREMF